MLQNVEMSKLSGHVGFMQTNSSSNQVHQMTPCDGNPYPRILKHSDMLYESKNMAKYQFWRPYWIDANEFFIQSNFKVHQMTPCDGNPYSRILKHSNMLYESKDMAKYKCWWPYWIYAN